MRTLTMGLAAAALCGVFAATSASAMPVDNLSKVDNVATPENVRMVCNRWGRCWWRPNYYSGYYAYGYRPYRGYGYRYGYGRRWHRW